MTPVLLLWESCFCDVTGSEMPCREKTEVIKKSSLKSMWRELPWNSRVTAPREKLTSGWKMCTCVLNWILFPFDVFLVCCKTWTAMNKKECMKFKGYIRFWCIKLYFVQLYWTVFHPIMLSKDDHCNLTFCTVSRWAESHSHLFNYTVSCCIELFCSIDFNINPIVSFHIVLTMHNIVSLHIES